MHPDLARGDTAVPAPAGADRHRGNAPAHLEWHRPAILFAAMAFLLNVLAAYPYVDLDLFHQMALIRESLALGEFPRGDLWAYTPTNPVVVHHEWGTGAVLYAMVVATGWGWAALAALRIVLVAVVAACVYRASRRMGADEAVLVLLSPFAVLLFAIGLSPVRAHLFTFTGIAVLLALVQSDRSGRRGWTVPWLLLWVVWLNLHGGFVLGLAFLGLYAVERMGETLWRGRRLGDTLREHGHLLAILCAMPVVVLLNPYGMGYVAFLRTALGMDRPLIGEWAPLWSPAAPPGLRAAFGFALALAAYAVAKRRTLLLPGLPMLVLAAWLALQHQRMAPIFAIVWLAHVPSYLGPTPLGALVRRVTAPVVRPAGVLALAVGAYGLWAASAEKFWQVRLPAPGDDYAWTAPVDAVHYLRASGFRGNLMTPFQEGAYVAWELYPRVRIGMDSRYEAAYPAGSLERNVALYAGRPGWKSVLSRTGTDAVLVPAGSPLAAMLKGDGGWRAAYSDAGYAVYLSRSR